VPFVAEPSRVVAHVDIVGHMVKRELKDVPVQLLKPVDFPFEVQIPAEYGKVSVTVEGVEEEMKGLTNTAVRAYVEVDDLRNEADVKATGSPYKRSVRLMFPPGMRVTESRATPAEITVILRKPE